MTVEKSKALAEFGTEPSFPAIQMNDTTQHDNHQKQKAANFIAAVRTRKREDLTAEIEQIHYSSAWCHLGNIAYRLGEESGYDRSVAEAKVDSQPWREVISDFHEHLDRNEIDPAREKISVGPVLDFDGEKETFIGDAATPEALALIAREYREGFAVPAEV